MKSFPHTSLLGYIVQNRINALQVCSSEKYCGFSKWKSNWMDHWTICHLAKWNSSFIRAL